MKKIAVIFNAPILGGAERSIIEQSKTLSNKGHQIDFFIPGHQESFGPLKRHILEEGHSKDNIKNFYFPYFILNISRTSGILRIITAIVLFPFIFLIAPRELGSYDFIWANGNKAGFYSYAVAVLIKFSGKLVWHVRDYPSPRFFNWLTKQCLNVNQTFQCTFVSNSASVSHYLEKVGLPKQLIGPHFYNPISTEQIVKNNPSPSIKTLSVVSMLAPWKGQHEVLLMAATYKKELDELGIEKILIYGEQIYKTSGKHIDYAEQLRLLNQKLALNSIEFKGNRPPQEIYKKADVLIHSSVAPEPFGRVITEAFLNKIPVISTALGGSGELVIEQKTGLTYTVGDIHQLYRQIKSLVEDRNKLLRITNNAFYFASSINKETSEKLLKFID